jgi:DNA-binding GntR family transcriptional regulator
VEAIRLTSEFHLYLARLTGNPLLERYLVEIISRCSLVMTMYGAHSADSGAREHRAIVEALVPGDFRRAGDLMKHHFEDVAARAQLSVRPRTDVRQVLADFAARIGDP